MSNMSNRLYEIREEIRLIENENLDNIQNQVFAEAYDHVVQLSCPRLPRDCQIEITRMLSPTPLPLSLLRPEAKKINRQGTDPEQMVHEITPIEKEIYELRESLSIDFDFSHLASIDSNQLLYLVSAFGSVQNYETFVTLSTLRSDVDVQNYHRQAIYIAFKYRNINLITYFFKYLKIYEKVVDKDLPSTMLGFAAEFGYVDIVREIMKNGKCDPAFDYNYAILWSASNGHLNVVKYLMEEVNLKNGIDPAFDDNCAVRYSAEAGHLDVVKYLMEDVDSKYGIDPAADDNYAIHRAARRRHLDVVKYFMGLDVKYGIDRSIGEAFLYPERSGQGQV